MTAWEDSARPHSKPQWGRRMGEKELVVVCGKIFDFVLFETGSPYGVTAGLKLIVETRLVSQTHRYSPALAS